MAFSSTDLSSDSLVVGLAGESEDTGEGRMDSWLSLQPESSDGGLVKIDVAWVSVVTVSSMNPCDHKEFP